MILYIDVQQRSGIKIIIKDNSQETLEDLSLFPLISRNYWEDTITTLAKLIIKHNISKICISTGQVFKHINRLINKLMQRYPDLKLMKAFGTQETKDKAFIAYNPQRSSLQDLKKGSTLQGLISNINDYGIFVDLGIQTQGLIHKNTLPPNSNFQFGNLITVEIYNVDLKNQKISLKLKNNNIAVNKAPKPKTQTRTHTALADALVKLKIGTSS